MLPVWLKINFSVWVWLFLTVIFEPQCPHLPIGNHTLLPGISLVWFLLSAQHTGGTERSSTPLTECGNRSLWLHLAHLPTCPGPHVKQTFVSFHRDSNFPQILRGICLETSLLNPAMMPRGSPAAHALPCSGPLSCVAISDASCRSWCGSAPSSGTKRVLVNWHCGKGLVSFIVCVKLLIFWAVVNLLKTYGRIFTVEVGGKRQIEIWTVLRCIPRHF